MIFFQHNISNLLDWSVVCCKCESYIAGHYNLRGWAKKDLQSISEIQAWTNNDHASGWWSAAALKHKTTTPKKCAQHMSAIHQKLQYM